MKKLLTLFTVLLTFGTQAQTNFFPSLRVGDTVYENARIENVTATNALIFHDGGATKIALSNMPAFIQRQYGYDPSKVVEIKKPEKRLVVSTNNPRATFKAQPARTITDESKLPHWGMIQILEITPGGPWPLCRIASDSGQKTVYLKNASTSAAQYWNQTRSLSAQIKTLRDQTDSDRKRLRSADAVEADYQSQYDQNREQFRARLHNNEQDLDRLQEQLSELQSEKQRMISALGIFTGQVYNQLEVWDCRAALQ